MNHLLLAGATALAIVAVSGAAKAVEVINEDELTYELNVITGETTTTLEVQPGDEVEEICDKCSLSIGDGEELEVEGDDLVFIRKGIMELKAN